MKMIGAGWVMSLRPQESWFPGRVCDPPYGWPQVPRGQATCGLKLENVATAVGLHRIQQAATGVKRKVALKNIVALKFNMYIILWSNI